MKLFKSFTAILLTVIIAMSLTETAEAGFFPDTIGHWAEDYIECAYSDGYLNSDDDGNFHLDEKLTAAQLVEILSKALNLPEHPVIYLNVKITKWYYEEAKEKEELQRQERLKNPNSPEYKAEKERVLKLVTSEYAGDYTTKWAEEHDYTAEEKEFWINVKDYSSSGKYLIWVNITNQRCNIFEGSRGQWKLIRTCIVGTGANGTSTPRGTWKVTYHDSDGWTTDTYTVKPVVGFKGGGYAFHSRLYYPRTETLKDTSIGFPVSHGCVRMLDEDIKWIYDNIPDGTTVVVY